MVNNDVTDRNTLFYTTSREDMICCDISSLNKETVFVVESTDYGDEVIRKSKLLHLAPQDSSVHPVVGLNHVSMIK